MLCTSMAPPASVMIAYTSDRPRAGAGADLLGGEERSKMRESVAASMPDPLSSTVRRT